MLGSAPFRVKGKTGDSRRREKGTLLVDKNYRAFLRAYAKKQHAAALRRLTRDPPQVDTHIDQKFDSEFHSNNKDSKRMREAQLNRRNLLMIQRIVKIQTRAPPTYKTPPRYQNVRQSRRNQFWAENRRIQRYLTRKCKQAKSRIFVNLYENWPKFIAKHERNVTEKLLNPRKGSSLSTLPKHEWNPKILRYQARKIALVRASGVDGTRRLPPLSPALPEDIALWTRDAAAAVTTATSSAKSHSQPTSRSSSAVPLPVRPILSYYSNSNGSRRVGCSSNNHSSNCGSSSNHGDDEDVPAIDYQRDTQSPSSSSSSSTSQQGSGDGAKSQPHSHTGSMLMLFQATQETAMIPPPRVPTGACTPQVQDLIPKQQRQQQQQQQQQQLVLVHPSSSSSSSSSPSGAQKPHLVSPAPPVSPGPPSLAAALRIPSTPFNRASRPHPRLVYRGADITSTTGAGTGADDEDAGCNGENQNDSEQSTQQYLQQRLQQQLQQQRQQQRQQQQQSRNLILRPRSAGVHGMLPPPRPTNPASPTTLLSSSSSSSSSLGLVGPMGLGLMRSSPPPVPSALAPALAHGPGSATSTSTLASTHPRDSVEAGDDVDAGVSPEDAFLANPFAGAERIYDIDAPATSSSPSASGAGAAGTGTANALSAKQTGRSPSQKAAAGANKRHGDQRHHHQHMSQQQLLRLQNTTMQLQKRIGVVEKLMDPEDNDGLPASYAAIPSSLLPLSSSSSSPFSSKRPLMRPASAAVLPSSYSSSFSSAFSPSSTATFSSPPPPRSLSSQLHAPTASPPHSSTSMSRETNVLGPDYSLMPHWHALLNQSNLPLRRPAAPPAQAGATAASSTSSSSSSTVVLTALARGRADNAPPARTRPWSSTSTSTIKASVSASASATRQPERALQHTRGQSDGFGFTNADRLKAVSVAGGSTAGVGGHMARQRPATAYLRRLESFAQSTQRLVIRPSTSKPTTHASSSSSSSSSSAPASSAWMDMKKNAGLGMGHRGRGGEESYGDHDDDDRIVWESDELLMERDDEDQGQEYERLQQQQQQNLLPKLTQPPYSSSGSSSSTAARTAGISPAALLSQHIGRPVPHVTLTGSSSMLTHGPHGHGQSRLGDVLLGFPSHVSAMHGAAASSKYSYDRGIPDIDGSDDGASVGAGAGGGDDDNVNNDRVDEAMRRHHHYSHQAVAGGPDSRARVVHIPSRLVSERAMRILRTHKTHILHDREMMQYLEDTGAAGSSAASHIRWPHALQQSQPQSQSPHSPLASSSSRSGSFLGAHPASASSTSSSFLRSLASGSGGSSGIGATRGDPAVSPDTAVAFVLPKVYGASLAISATGKIIPLSSYGDEDDGHNDDAADTGGFLDDEEDDDGDVGADDDDDNWGIGDGDVDGPGDEVYMYRDRDDEDDGDGDGDGEGDGNDEHHHRYNIDYDVDEGDDGVVHVSSHHQGQHRGTGTVGRR